MQFYRNIKKKNNPPLNKLFLELVSHFQYFTSFSTVLLFEQTKSCSKSQTLYQKWNLPASRSKSPSWLLMVACPLLPTCIYLHSSHVFVTSSAQRPEQHEAEAVGNGPEQRQLFKACTHTSALNPSTCILWPCMPHRPDGVPQV